MNTEHFYQWYKSLDEDPEYLAEDFKIEFAICVEKLMDKRGMNKSDLARLIESSPAYITKVLSGNTNLTIESMTKLSFAVGGKLHINVADRLDNFAWVNLPEKDDSSFRKNFFENESSLTWAKQNLESVA
ncbi:hypothetical protein A3194_05275 [Candidatus Thiodiazotropha endoloripes]|uniref:helix-turn-helix domain-containing protein n=1 Tax=Candidatus Thiodiazotropha endoloripes TaxID=1818881 RepID=UPI00083D0E2B|nr:helix-turn-helix transcriptional regulator [Candidatus Thiodiazotropha endoloripes]ODB94072.1 hypothetical protein A3194_05275 [Candidatus Thiodiazotropha endoloripes]